MVRMISPAIRWRSTSPTISPANGASDQIGSERKRSNRPLPRSVDSPMPEYTALNTTVCTRMPGRKNCR